MGSINILVFSRYLYLVFRFKLLADLLVKNYIDLICSINILVFKRYPSLVIIFKLPFWSSSVLVVFHFGRLPFWLFSILVVFHFDRFQFWSSTIFWARSSSFLG